MVVSGVSGFAVCFGRRSSVVVHLGRRVSRGRMIQFADNRRR